MERALLNNPLHTYRQRMVDEALVPARRAYRFTFEVGAECVAEPPPPTGVPESRPLWQWPLLSDCAAQEAVNNASGVDLRSGQVLDGSFSCPLSQYSAAEAELRLELTEVAEPDENMTRAVEALFEFERTGWRGCAGRFEGGRGGPQDAHGPAQG